MTRVLLTPIAAVLLLAASYTMAVDGPTPAAKWWAVQPLRKPVVPEASDSKAAVRNPIDRFILAKLSDKGLSPAPEADRLTLIRRLYYDLIGLPPTPAEIEAFEKDAAPDAYEKLVEKLLASQHYGERWARRWMDAVHFAETHGHDQDRVRENAWPYRDYLIRAFNSDTPYTRFVREQIAGDVLYPEDVRAVAALGMLAAGPWDESSLRDIREETLDRQIARYLDRDDMLTTAMQTFTSTTVHCARCHDHKFDAITQDDYYSLQAVFAGVDRANRDFDSNPELHRRRIELVRRRTEILAGGTANADTSAAEKQWLDADAKWQVLVPDTFVSTGGATLTKKADGSVISGGTRPDRETMMVAGPSPLTSVTAIRIEALADEGLPLRGPGRQGNGNFHLSEVQLQAIDAETEVARPIPLASATADFDQTEWHIGLALDGIEKTAWGIYPEVGKSHYAVLVLKTPLILKPKSRLAVVLKQLHGEGHIIGRARISVTDCTVVPSALPADVRVRLAIAPVKRTADDHRKIAAALLVRQLDAEIASLPAPGKVYAAASDFVPDGSLRPAGKPRPIHVLKRGEITRPGAIANPGAYSALASLKPRFDLKKPDDEGSRRAALALWLTDRDNPLVWRSIVNRVWGWHFGTGLAPNPNDFGAMGGAPSHPELLDWLAVEFRDGKQSIKELHRLIVTSATYRRSSNASAEAMKVDGENRWLARMPRVRLDAEQIRDATLLAAGRLDLRMGGPSDRQFALKPGVHVTPVVDYDTFDLDSDGGRRRSVYRFLFRTLPDPLFAALDCPAGDQLAPMRANGVTVQQALALWNSKFVTRQSEHFGKRLEADSSDAAARVRVACLWCWGRPPTADESKKLADHAAKYGLASLCRVLFNSNEFVFVN